MAERTLKSYDPYAYHVNNVTDLNKNVVKAYKNGDQDALNGLLFSALKSDYNVFICVNRSYHAFVLCAANRDIVERNPLNIHPEYSTNPDEIPSLLLVSEVELCFEHEESRLYKIRFKLEPFINVKDRVKRAYFIGHFKDVSSVAFQCAALGASPKRYSVLLDDCVEFAKRFCKELLKYASNDTALEKEVESQIKSATASGFTAEQLSREIKSSAYWMNTILGGSDVTTYIVNGKTKLLVLGAVLVYPILINWLMSRK